MAYVDPRLAREARPVRIGRADGTGARRAARCGQGSDLAFLDQRVPGYQREIINMIGMGVTENVKDPSLAPKINAGAHGFAVTYVRNTPKGNGAALHRHPTEEVFIAAKGPWEVFWLEGAAERVITLQPGDIVNVPIGVYRGFRNASDDLDAVLIAVVGGPDTGKVDWHPSVIDLDPTRRGSAVDEDGKLIEVEGRGGVGYAGANSRSPPADFAGKAGAFGVAKAGSRCNVGKQRSAKRRMLHSASSCGTWPQANSVTRCSSPVRRCIRRSAGCSRRGCRRSGSRRRNRSPSASTRRFR